MLWRPRDPARPDEPVAHLPAGAHRGPGPRDVLAWQARAGNAAVAQLLRGDPTRVGTAAGGVVLQRYAKVSGKRYDLVSDDGKMAVKDHSRKAWAESANIAASNAVLARNRSKAKIEAMSGRDVKVKPPGAPPGAAATTLTRFKMVDRASGAEAELQDDCGTANQQMMGAEAAGEWSFVAANKLGAGEEFTGKSAYQGDDHAPGGIVSTTEKLSGEIYVRIFAREFGKTLSRVDALKEWSKLSAADRKRLSKQYGINEFAAPKVGQGITIGSERDMPGAVPGGYNFHFALNLMASGADYITLEDYDSSGVKYYFDMYGPASKGQSFAEDPSNTGALGNKTTTMVVEHPHMLEGRTRSAGVKLLHPSSHAELTTLASGTEVRIRRRGVHHLLVEITKGPHTGKTGWIPGSSFVN